MSISAEYQGVKKSILRWNNSREKYLNIISPPYNTAEIFLDIIVENILKGNKVLYITGESEETIEIIQLMRNKMNFTDYSYYRGKSLYGEPKLVICNYENSLKLNSDFKLVIYDDIRSMPRYSRFEIIDIASRIKECRFIAYSIESIFNNCRNIDIYAHYCNVPIVEPRIIKTRIDINRDIPFALYEYLKWFIEANRNVVIPMKDENIMFNLFRYLSNLKFGMEKKILLLNKNHEKGTKNVLKNTKGSIIITNDFDMVCECIQFINVIAYFYDSNVFDYKTLVYFCGRTGGDFKLRGEVIFITNKENSDIEKAKSITRAFNKVAWESGLFNL